MIGEHTALDPSLTGANYLVALADLGLHDIAQVGGKAAGLGELIQAGLPVPTGFCITTTAYRRFVAEAGLSEQVAARLASAASLEPPALEKTACAIQALFARAPIPPDVAAAIERAYHELGEPAVAVRSSAIAEDLPGASFAGQQDTFLNVARRDALLDAVRRCWASLWNARAIHYRQRVGLGEESTAMGLVVQVLIPADVSGVLFTANPNTGERTELVVNASFGLGEAIVSGAVTPDTYVLDKTTLARKQAIAGAKELAIVPAAKDGTTRMSTPGGQGEWALRDDSLNELAALALRAEAHFGVPLDIEWAVAGGQAWILQARPITKLPPPPLRDVRWEPPTPGSAWVRRQVVENLPEPLSPLFDELYVRQGLERSLDAVMTFFRTPWFRLEEVVDRPFFTTINGYAYQRGNFKLHWKSVPLIFRATVAIWRVMFAEAVTYWRERALTDYLATIDRWKQLDPSAAPDEQLLAGVRELAWADALYWYACAIVIANAKMTDALLDRFLAIAAPGRGLTSGLFLRGFASKTLDAEAELETLTEQIRTDDALHALVAATPAEHLPEVLADTTGGRALLAEFQSYLDRYGHQVYNLDFVAPTQADDPLPVLLSLKAMAQRPARDVRAQQAALARGRDERVAETMRSFDPLRRRLFRLLLGWAQRYGPNREQALFYMGAAWPTLRRLALELGRRLAQDGLLTTPEHVFYLESGELETAIAARAAGQARRDLAQLARERRELREARKRLHPPAAVPPSHAMKIGPLDLSAWETQRRNVDDGAELHGFAVSPGRVSAAASVIRSAADFGKMEPGTVLVCPTTTPAWTPLFSQARALVTDVGGILAHGSIVAREYGIPTVMGTGNATQRIAHGQVITVDGDRGVVELGEAQHQAVVSSQNPRDVRLTIALGGTIGFVILMWWWRRGHMHRGRRP